MGNAAVGFFEDMLGELAFESLPDAFDFRLDLVQFMEIERSSDEMKIFLQAGNKFLCTQMTQIIKIDADEKCFKIGNIGLLADYN